MKYIKIVIIFFLISIRLVPLSGQTTSPLFIVEATGGCGDISNCSINRICFDIMIVPDTSGIINAYNIWLQYTGGNMNYVSDQACRTLNGTDNSFDSQGYYRFSGVQGSTMATEDVPVRLHNICFTYTSLADIQDREIFVGGTVFGVINSTLTYNNPILNEVIPEYSFKMNESNVSCILLPVNWLGFQVTNHNETAVLDWTTSEEHNNKGFEVLRSPDGQDYEKIGWVDAIVQPSAINHYQFIDLNPMVATNYYRLKQYDLDGHFDFSPVRWTTFHGERFAVEVMPNPAKEFLEVKIETQEPIIEISLMDQVGRVVLYKKLNFTNNAVRLELDNLNAGMYTVIVQSGPGLYIESIVIVK